MNILQGVSDSDCVSNINLSHSLESILLAHLTEVVESSVVPYYIVSVGVYIAETSVHVTGLLILGGQGNSYVELHGVTIGVETTVSSYHVVVVGVVGSNGNDSLVSIQLNTLHRVKIAPVLILCHILTVHGNSNSLAVILLRCANVSTEYVSTVGKTTQALHDVSISKTSTVTVPCLEHTISHTIETCLSSRVLGVLAHQLFAVEAPALKTKLHVGICQLVSHVLCFLCKAASKCSSCKTQAQQT